MSSEQPGRTSRGNTAGSPVGSTIAIIVTVVAVVLGFFILREIRSDSEGSAPARTTTTVEETTTTVQETTTTTTPMTYTGTKVQVANASVQDGVARQLTTALAGKGFDTADATNAVIKLDATKVLYDDSIPEAKAVADTVAITIGGAVVEVVPLPPPVRDGKLADGVGVLVLLGNDKAGKTLAQMNGEVESTGTTTTTG